MAYDLSEYVDVKTRLKQALATFPLLRIVEHRPEITQVGEQLFIECSVTVSRDPDDPIPVTAYMFEPYPGRTPFTKLSEQANGATSALGRALGYMGFGIDVSIASSNEIMGREQAKQTPVTKPAPIDPDSPRVAELDEKRAQIGSARTSLPATNSGGATAGQIKMLTDMCKERGLDFDPASPLTYSEAKTMFLELKQVPKVK
jgi:hypothetical protein